MNHLQAQNIVHMLQHDPLYFRAFGPFWWPVKAALKRAGFTQANAPHLGSYVDPQARDFFSGRSQADVLDEALLYQAERVHNLHDPHHETPDGDPYLLHDEDFPV
jgi:hypothetical protein